MSDEIVIGDGNGLDAGLDILAASAVRAALTDCAGSFQRATGIGVTLRFDTSGGVNKRAASGDRADVFASSLDSIEDIVGRGLTKGAPVTIGSSRIAMGVRSADAAPDISTTEKFRTVMLAAKSIARGDPAGGGTAGNYLHGVLENLGLLEPTRDKTILRVGGYNVMKEVAERRADFGLTQGTEIVAVAGVRIGTWLPAELQLVTRYAVAQGGAGAHGETAERFLAHVAGAEGQAAFARAGFAPA